MTSLSPLVAVTLALLLFLYLRTRNQTSLPPGPPKSFIVGNAFNMPRRKAWMIWSAWKKTYGDIISLSIFGRNIIVLNSAEVAFELLHRRSAIYSDRPNLPMGGDLVGWNRGLSLTPYGEQFRFRRKLLHQVFSPRPVVAHFPALERNVKNLLILRLLKTPERFADHIRDTAAATVLGIAYGYVLKDKDNESFVQKGHEALGQFSSSTAPGAFLVDIIPILKYVPAWFPGAEFRRKAAIWRKTASDAADSGFAYTNNELTKGTAPPSFIREHLSQSLTPEKENALKWTAFSIFGGGFDTTSSAILTFFLAMTLYPEVQAKAQAEIDMVIGNARLPTMADRSSLPYVEALVREVFRWGPPVPGGVPHRVMKDDIYNGYRIPAGSTVVSNIWGMTHDEQLFPEPDKFIPERYLEIKELEPSKDSFQLAFGFGRRVCPGQHFATASVFMATAMTLATMNITKASDKEGKVIEPVADWHPGTISHPFPFQCKITPRFLDIENLVLPDQVV
ncbi:hypothetical protein M422DRAFT_34906 [Sphaerobolus stellatus SS14]|uniref:Unplaced genomic scaffold SPHSTscaffold_120, whole genome shotgun sequence n=1 Tax=Sphaerobolus stellatus (strain SS14) TaxID=990650 RepID=A0A0C9TWL3_SPHS4|nr:hypothetical protein M422DRAFT_34906 [Sphaerobolus stellatus SS14]